MVDSNSNMENEIRRTVEGINKSSRTGDIEKLKHFCHENVVIIPPGFVQRAEGRETYLKSVEEFCSLGSVLEYKELSMKIDIFGDVAIVYYSYETKWKMEDKTFNETGNDVMVLSRTEGKWLLIWRTLIPVAQDS